MTENGQTALIETLAAHLEATAELPLDREANRWLGEAGAIATDAAEADLTDSVLAERVETILDLLAEIDETGHPEADEHVAAARRAGERLLDRQT
ncbi:MAG: hypothetical protein ABEH64_06145 [Salinirussus sp.]